MNPLLLQIFNRPWLIDQKSAVDYGWAISALMEGKLVFEANKESFKPRMITAQYPSSSQKQRTGIVAVIPIQGPLMQRDQDCGPVGMDTMGKYIVNADNDPDVAAIFLDIDSPGGTASGTPTLGKIIASTKKPIIAFINESAFSAAYWLASQADLVIANDAKAEVGSIGVMLKFSDLQPAYERLGVKFHEIYSSLSSDKNKDYRNILKGDYDQYRTDTLDPLAEYFIDNVKQGRGAKITDESIFKGRTVFADNAIALGLVDRIATYDEAIQIALEMADKFSKKNTAKNTQTQISSMKKRPLLLAALKVESLEESDGGSFLNEAQLDAFEAQLAAHQAAIDAVSAERDQANASLKAANDKAVQDGTTKETEITTLKSAVATLEGTVDALKKNPAEAGASVVVKADVEASNKDVDPLLAKINACSTIQERMAVMKESENSKKL